MWFTYIQMNFVNVIRVPDLRGTVLAARRPRPWYGIGSAGSAPRPWYGKGSAGSAQRLLELGEEAGEGD